MLQDGGGSWLEAGCAGVRGGRRLALRAGLSLIAIGLICGTVLAGLARGQDLVPAPPDFKPESLPDPITPPPAFDAPAPAAAAAPVPALPDLRQRSRGVLTFASRIRLPVLLVQREP